VTAISAVAAFCWAVENKYEGLCYPEKLPHEYILNICEPYLEPLVSLQSDWDPLKDRSWYSLWDYGDMFQEYPTPDDMWQFPTFLVDAVPLESCDKLYQQK
jgi:homospermidine synthase